MENFCNFSEHLQIFEVATCNSTSEVATVNTAFFFVVENFPATCNYPEYPTILGTQENNSKYLLVAHVQLLF